jgi:hypothetical protein
MNWIGILGLLDYELESYFCMERYEMILGSNDSFYVICSISFLQISYSVNGAGNYVPYLEPEMI